jgi:hypothetical protein
MGFFDGKLSVSGPGPREHPGHSECPHTANPSGTRDHRHRHRKQKLPPEAYGIGYENWEPVLPPPALPPPPPAQQPATVPPATEPEPVHNPEASDRRNVTARKGHGFSYGEESAPTATVQEAIPAPTELSENEREHLAARNGMRFFASAMLILLLVVGLFALGFVIRVSDPDTLPRLRWPW